MFGFSSSNDETEEDVAEKLQEELSEMEQQTEEDRDTETLLGEEYSIIGKETENAGPYEVIEHTESGEVVAGPKVRHMFERVTAHPNEQIWLGYEDTAQKGFRETPLDFTALRRHLWVSGTTGAGKTTFLQNKAVQHAYAGHGFCNIDPKASDTIELLQMLPSHRMDDVIFLEPGSPEFDRNVTINMLDMPPIENEAQREKEIESRVENLQAIFDTDDYWGPRMESITESMGRAMLHYNVEVALDPDRPPSEKYSIIDMYDVLQSERKRMEFVETVGAKYEFLRRGLEKIAQMKDDDVMPLTRRIKSWVENGIVRKIIGSKDTSIDWDQVVDENKILLVRIPVDSQDVHQMIALTVLRNLWSAKKRQDRDPNRPTKPYFLQLDEFERIANDNLPIEDMLVRARSMWLSVTIGTQYPYQIEKDHPAVMRAVENNANTRMAMRTPGERDASLLMSGFRGYNKEDLVALEYYRAWTKVPEEDGEESEALNIRTFAPYPPLRNESLAKSVIKVSLREHGTQMLTDTDILRSLNHSGFAGPAGGGTTAESIKPTGGADTGDLSSASENPLGEAEAIDPDDLPEDDLLEGVYAAQVQYADEESYVEKERAVEEIERRFGETGYDSKISNAFEKNEYIQTDRVDGEPAVKLTEGGKAKVFSADTGSSASGGGSDHRYILQESYRAFTKLGALTYLPTQEGDSLPDGVADLPIDPLQDADSLEEVHELEAKLKENYSRLYDISQGRHISIEAETSTIKKPMQTLTNLRKALESDRMCVFTCKDATFDDVDNHGFTYWPGRGEKIIYDTSGSEIDYENITCVSETDKDGCRQFYNKNAQFRVGEGRVAVRPAVDSSNELTWHETPDGDVVAETDDGMTVARFSQPQKLEDPEDINVYAYREQNDEGNWVVREGMETDSGKWGQHSEVTHGPYSTVDELEEEWQSLYQPFIPENELPHLPEEEDFTFVVFPDSNNEEYDEPMVYEQGELEPLYPEEMDVDAAIDADGQGNTDSGPQAQDSESEGTTATTTEADEAATEETPPTDRTTSDDQGETNSSDVSEVDFV